ncbi:MAG: hypothetical protein ACRECH_08705, partial [Nitrososphaerales archaeon]
SIVIASIVLELFDNPPLATKLFLPPSQVFLVSCDAIERGTRASSLTFIYGLKVTKYAIKVSRRQIMRLPYEFSGAE